MAIKDGILTTDTLNLILLVDNSYSMIDGKIEKVNYQMPILKNRLMKLAEDQGVELKIRIIAFSDEAIWKVGSVTEGEDIANVVWTDLEVVGETCTSKAIREANKALRKEYLGSHALRPVVILVTDGYCTDLPADYIAAVDEMKKRLAGNSGKEKVTRIAIGVGENGDYNRDDLVAFASEGFIDDEKQPLVFDVENPDKLGKVINLTAVTSMISSITDEAVSIDTSDIDEDDWVQ